MRKKQITIHKKNELTRGGDKYSVFAKRLLNTIYYILQKYDYYKYKTISIPFANIREMLQLQKEQNYVDIMKKAFLELKQPIELHNFKHPNGSTYDWYATSFINNVGFEKRNDKWWADIEVNDLIKTLMQLKGNFTKLDLIKYTNKMRTKYAMKLYEYLKSFDGYFYIDITQKHMLKLLGLENSKTYKYYTDLKRLIERQIKEIQQKTDLQQIKLIDNKILAKDKIFRIIIDPKNKKKADIKKAQEKLKEISENLFTRF